MGLLKEGRDAFSGKNLPVARKAPGRSMRKLREKCQKDFHEARRGFPRKGREGSGFGISFLSPALSVLIYTYM